MKADPTPVRIALDKYAQIVGDTPRKREAILAQRAAATVAKQAPTAGAK